MNTSHRLVVPLSDVGKANPGVVGGKARGLAVIARSGLTAPDGFVITTPVHVAALKNGGRIPVDVAHEIEERVRAFDGAPLAVRSSARGEDGAEHSHAGQYLTRLGMRGPSEVLDAVIECWQSAADQRAAAYRADRGHEDTVHMAVIVQRLAGGEAAGVCMSRDPVTGDRARVVINAAFGLGELVVSGLVTPDDYRLGRDDGRLVSFEPGYKDMMLVADTDGVREVTVPEHLREARVLNDTLLAEIYDGLILCEQELGHPADCEFSVVDGRVVWLQCRPMTALGTSDSDI